MVSTEGRFWGVDIGGSFAKIGYLRGEDFVLTGTIPTGTESAPSDILGMVAERILFEDPRPAAAGLGTAGMIDRVTGVVDFSPNLPLWSGSPAARILQDRIHAPVSIDNDCNVFAIGAMNSGEIPRRGLWIFLTLGTGIGGTIINDGSILYGTGTAGEFGHTTVREGGNPCPCGSSGCWETYAGSGALQWYYRRISARSLPPREISRLAGGGNSHAIQAYREFGRWFGIGLANLANCFAPSGFFIAGGLSTALRHFEIPARQEYTRRCRHPWSLSLLEDSPEAGAYGAASMVREKC